MAYTPQQWHDDTTDSPYGPISGDRLNYIEAGIQAAAGTADAALALAGTASGGAALGTAAPIIDGVAAAGSSGSAAHEDHVHPTDTTRAALASPTFSGTPSLPTASVAVTQSAADSSLKLATTAFVTTADNLKANLAGPTFTGTVTLPSTTVATTPSANDNSTKPATTAYVDTADALKANLAGPTFTGAVILPTGTTGVTQSASDNSTKLATTAYVDTADALKANLASPTFTGTVTITTAAADDTTTKAASTSFVMTRMLGRGAKMDRTSAARFASASGGVAAYSESMPMYIRSTVGMTSQTLFFTLCPVEPGQVIANQIVHVSATGVTWGSNNDGHWWMALYSTDLGTASRLRVTSDLGHTGLAALAVEDRAFTSSYTVPAGVYELYAAFVVYVGTGGSPATCSLVGSSGGVGDYGAEVTGALRAAGRLDTNITTGGPPSTPAAAADIGVYYRAVLH